MMVANIREVGLKKPITVVRRKEADAEGKQFDLVCGQGRIEAFVALGETAIRATKKVSPVATFTGGPVLRFPSQWRFMRTNRLHWV